MYLSLRSVVIRMACIFALMHELEASELTAACMFVLHEPLAQELTKALCIHESKLVRLHHWVRHRLGCSFHTHWLG